MSESTSFNILIRNSLTMVNEAENQSGGYLHRYIHLSLIVLSNQEIPLKTNFFKQICGFFFFF